MQMTRLATLGGLWLVASATLAQTAPATSAAPASPAATASAQPKFPLKGFRVTGDNPLGEAETRSALAPFVRDDATMETLQQATAALEGVLRARGYGLHRVALPPQEVGDTVTLNVVRFSIGKVTFEGLNYFDEGNIRRSLPELQEAGTPNFKTLAIQAAIANDNPSKQVQVSLRESKEADKIDAHLLVKETKPWNFAASLSNAGSAASGQDRLTLSGGHSNLFNRDHQFVGAYTTSLENTSGVRQLGLSYRVPVYELNGVVGVSYTRSDVVGDFGAFSSTGAGRTFGVNYTYHTPPDGGYRGYFSAGFDDKVYEAVQINGVLLPGQQQRRSAPLHVGYNARMESDGTYWGYNAEFAANTGMGSGNSLAAYVTEDPRITTAAWTAIRGGGTYMANFAGDWVWNVRGQFQYSNDALISGEQFGLGGVSSVRGTGERPISGDRGVLMTLEVTTPALAPNLRLLGFLDAGWLSNVVSNGTTKPGNDHLSSVGFGLRYSAGRVSVTADYGRIIRGSNVPITVNSLSPQKGDDKLHVNVSVQF